MTTGDPDPQPIQSDETAYPPPTVGGGQPGSLGVRLGARIIDSIIIYVIAIVIGYVLTLVTTYAQNAFVFALINGIIAGVLTFAYFVGFESSTGATPGKKLLGLSVRGPGGADKPTAQQSAIRNAWTLFTIVPPQVVGGVLYLASVIAIAVTANNSPTKQGIHDRLAGGTAVIKG
jgi:uncharacterized RDD family membrane protein YckC